MKVTAKEIYADYGASLDVSYYPAEEVEKLIETLKKASNFIRIGYCFEAGVVINNNIESWEAKNEK